MHGNRALSPFLTWFHLLKASWHSAAASVAAQTLVAATAVLASRALGASAYGSVVAIAAYYGWFTLIGSYPCAPAIPSFLASDKETDSGKKRAIATVVVLKSALSLLGGTLAYLWLPVLMPSVWRGPLHNAAVIYIVVFTLPPIRLITDVIAQSAGWLRFWSVSSVVGTGLPVALLAVYGLTHVRLTPHSYIALLVAATIASTAFTLYLLVSKVGGLSYLRPRADVARPFLAEGRGPWLSVLGNVLCNYGVRTIIATSISSRELALYDVVYVFIGWVTGIGLAVTIPALSEWSRLAAEGDIDGLRRDVRRRQRATAAMLGAVGLVSLVAARPILLAIYGPEYVGAAPVLRIMGLSLALGGLGGWYWIAVYALAQPWRIAWPNISSNVVLVLLAYVLVRFTSLGITGTAIAYVFAVAIWLAVYEWEFRRALSARTSRTANPADPRLP